MSVVATIPTCFVCAETFNLSTRKLVTCGACPYVACRGCYQTYILGSYQDPACMDCRRPWTRRFMADTFTQTFIKGAYANHRRDVLFEQERALLAYTQPFVERAVRADEITALIETERLEVDKYDEQIRAIARLKDVVYRRMRVLEEQRAEVRGNAPAAREAAAFVRRCTAPDCLGFLSSQWKCGVCSLWSCPDCYVVKGAARDVAHECDPDTLATARLLASDTKTCPKCGTGIFKIEGCNVMFCTECHTAFDWRTSTIITRNIHNPHYFEWRERAGNVDRDPMEVACGRELDNAFTASLFRLLRRIDEAVTHILSRDAAAVADVAERMPGNWHVATRDTVERLMELARHLPQYGTNMATDNLQARVHYMRGHLTENEFKGQVADADRRMERRRELGQIFGMVLHSATDVLHRLRTDLLPRQAAPVDAEGVVVHQTPVQKRAQMSAAAAGMLETVRLTLAELEALRAYANECLWDLSRVFGNTSTPLFDVNLRLGTLTNTGLAYTTGTVKSAAATARRRAAIAAEEAAEAERTAKVVAAAPAPGPGVAAV
jgi:hypothetical protein